MPFSNRVYSTLSVVLLLGAISTLAAINLLTVFRLGLASSDDSYYALIAKSLANGTGYGLPISSTQILLFDPYSGNGPAITLPIALGIVVLGATYWLPGLVTFGIFSAQIATLAVIWAREVGPKAFSYVAIALGLLTYFSRNAWFFPFGLGEAPAFGWILLGITLLAMARSLPEIAVSGLCLSLAITTKQIALFAAAGAVLGWMVIEAAKSKSLWKTTIAIFALGVSIASTCVIFEIYKLIALGFNGYVQNLKAIIGATGERAVGIGLDSRFDKFFSVFEQNYITRWSMAVLILISVAAVLLVRHASRKSSISAFTMIAWCSVIAHFIYVAVLSTLLSRYYWIGFAILSFVLPISLLLTSWTAFGAMLVASLLTVADAGALARLRDIYQYARESSTAADQLAVAAQIAAEPTLPIVTPQGGTLEIAYLVPYGHPWFQTNDIEAIRGQPFTFVVNAALGDRASRVFEIADQVCEKSDTYRTYIVRKCSIGFWDRFH